MVLLINKVSQSFPLLRCLPVLLLCLLAGTPETIAQRFRYEAAVSAPETDGYYRLELPVEIGGLARPGFPDLRLLDNQGKQTPYLLDRATAATAQRQFVRLPIRKQEHTPGCCTELVVENPNRQPLQGLQLRIGNADVVKPIELSGSDDGQKWYVVKALDHIRAIRNPTGTSELQLLDFPLNDYALFRFRISDSASAPLRIIEAGYYSSSAAGSAPWLPVPQPRITRSDSARATWLLLTWPQLQLIERLSFQVQAQPLFLREGELLRKLPRYRSRHTRWQGLQGFTLNPRDTVVLLHETLQTDSLWLRIENHDNPALTQLQPRCWQQPRFLVAYLQAGQPYHLRFGNDSLTAPRYDLAHFSGQLPQDLPVLHVQQVQRTTEAAAAPIIKAAAPWWKSQLVIWVALAIVTVVLVFITNRLLQDMNGRKEKE